jgi:alpha-D-ribose 1-methylphosphonate 5-triphosphate synthase subunit PhnI
MGYAAARGGLDAIEAARGLVRRLRPRGLAARDLAEAQRLAVDRVMGEGGLWAPELAAAALAQAEGDVIEAAHLVRSTRSTLPRVAVTVPTSTDEIEVMRRVVPAYQDPPGPQLLGRTLDYTSRVLEDPAAPPRPLAPVPDHAETGPVGAGTGAATGSMGRRPRRLLDVLRDLDLVVDRRRRDDPEPADITTQAVRPGAPRSARLAVMARAETGALVQLWYRNILGPDDHLHEVTLGEVRHGRLPVRVLHPITGRPVRIGAVRVTEVEAIEDLDGPDEDRTRFDVGYGLCLGHNERKAIAMANLDIAAERDAGRSALEQSILQTTDGLDASGFLEHLKLPHYVTFRSMVERKLAMRTAAPAARAAGTEVSCR